LKKKKDHKNHPPKRAQPYALARWRKKKQVGVEQEEVGHIRLANA
jgi:hypothetical protein